MTTRRELAPRHCQHGGDAAPRRPGLHGSGRNGVNPAREQRPDCAADRGEDDAALSLPGVVARFSQPHRRRRAVQQLIFTGAGATLMPDFHLLLRKSQGTRIAVIAGCARGSSLLTHFVSVDGQPHPGET